jgi:hypothetical protein
VATTPPADPPRHTGGGRRWPALVVAGVGLLLGVGAAVGLNDALGIEFVERDRPEDPPIHTGEVPAPGPFEAVAAIVVPEDDAWVERGAGRLADAIADRTGTRPALVGPAADPPACRRIDVGTPDPAALGRTDLEAAEGSEAFRLDADDAGLTLRAATRDGQLVGLAWIADRIATGASEADLVGEVVEPDLSRRLVDLGGLGAPREPADRDPTNYSHDVRRFETALLPGPPYVDADAFAAVEADLVDYLDLMRSYGNNGLVADGFLELIDFDRVGDGEAVYPAGSPYRDRHAAMREHLGGLWELADEAGMDVYLMHTELALTPPLEAHLLDELGSIDTEDPRLWEVYQAGIAELFERFPSVDGLIVRVGEAGDIYDPERGLEYSTRLAVRTDAAVRTMLEAFLEVAEAYDREIVFRSWTVGVGEVGRLHHDADVYERVLGELDSPHLIVSTKYVQGDFYSFVPLNETLLTGHHRRMVELQNRLEFEGFMAFPNLVGPLHGAALAEFTRANERVEGAWMWNQDGGPQQAGPRSLYPFHGFWHHVDANTYTTSRFAFDVDADPSAVAADWVRRTFGDDPEVVAPLTEVLARSREAATTGLYVSAYADQLVRALGLETTPMMWIFEWDIVSGDSAVLATNYLLARDELDAAIAEGERAVAIAREMRDLAAGVDPARVTDPELLEGTAASLEYQVDLFETLAAWRATFLEYHRWLDTGDGTAREGWQLALERFETRRAGHEARYGTDLDLPAYSFDAVDRGLVHATRTAGMAWVARVLLGALAAVLVVGALARAGRVRRGPVADAAATVTASLLAPGSGEAAGALLPRRLRVVVVALTAAWLLAASLVFSSFASPHHLALQGLVLVVFAGVLVLVAGPLRGGRDGASGVLLGLTGPLLAVTGPLVGVLAVRGPGYFWLRFWTDAGFRTWFTTLGVALLVWLAVAVVTTLRRAAGGGVLAGCGGLLVAAGATVAAVGAVPGVAGLERMLTAINDELAVLPLGLSRILGITVHLGIPTALPGWMVAAGANLSALGVVLLWGGGRRRPHRLPRRGTAT